MSAKHNRSFFFAKDEDTLPFFSIHPATMAGKVLRIALIAFMVIVLLLNLLTRLGLTFMKLYDLYYLVYIIPFGIVIALLLVALYKRISIPAARIITVGILGFLTVSMLITVGSMVSVTSGFAFSPTMGLELEDGTKIAIMCSCVYPEDAPTVTVNEGEKDEYTTQQYTYHVDAYKYTAIPAEGNGTTEGAIYVSTSSTFNVEVEWTGENSCRYYLSSDSAGSGYGEILITFDDNSQCAAEEGATYRSSSENAAGTHTAFLYRSDSYIEMKTTSIYNLTSDCFQRVYSAYPTTLYYFLKTGTRVEGQITVEPFGTLDSINVDKASLENDIVLITPGDTCIGAEGSITIYLNEKASDAAASTDATAAPTEATEVPATATQAPAADADASNS